MKWVDCMVLREHLQQARYVAGLVNRPDIVTRINGILDELPVAPKVTETDIQQALEELATIDK